MLFDLQRSELHGWVRLAVVGELDLAAAPRVRSAVVALVGAHAGSVEPGPLSVLLDISGVHFIDSSGLGVVVGAVRRVRAVGGEIAVVVETPQVREMFGLIGLDRIMSVFPSVEDVPAATEFVATAALTAGRDG